MSEKYELLTNREFEVLYFVEQGLTNKEIAEILNVTHHTIKAHVSTIIHKLDCRNRTGVALYSQKHGIFTHLQGLKQP